MSAGSVSGAAESTWVLFRPELRGGKFIARMLEIDVRGRLRVTPNRKVFKSERSAKNGMSEAGYWVDRDRNDPPLMVGSWR